MTYLIDTKLNARQKTGLTPDVKVTKGLKKNDKGVKNVNFRRQLEVPSSEASGSGMLIRNLEDVLKADVAEVAGKYLSFSTVKVLFILEL